ncbi:hypothetical protein AMATHDRAFT_51448 [Amanita thiersii Skay4041]|uniref:F-box domain-containing protein n=1 Tax=Amanita thiersii Skay4041 TaxID=703135 RepID=A0A2A9N6Q5_9AGAR|nr:hypothetical protein AMATHDRAFT_51448 [Amanita thiersii Skay4041]
MERQTIIHSLSPIHKVVNDTSPIATLSEDVLRYIFSLCAEEVTLPLQEEPHALTLLQVCCSWREVALDTPELWNRFCINYQYADQRHVQEWLLRAKRFLVSASTTDHMDDRCLYSLIRLFINQYQLKRLRIYLRCNQLLSFLSNAKNETLEDLELYSEHRESEHRGPQLFLPAQFPFPNLKTLYFYSRHYCLDLQGIRYLPWNRLSKLTLEVRTTPSILLESLKEAATLESLEIMLTAYDNYSPPEDQIILPQLKKLILRFRGSRGMPCKIFIHIVHPKLETLQIQGIELAWDSVVFSHLTRQSNFENLCELLFQGSIVSNIPFVKLLKELPHLRKIWFPIGTQITEDVIVGLSTGNLGPRLTSIETIGCPVDPQRLLTMAEARQRVAYEKNNAGQEILPFENITIEYHTPSNHHQSRIDALKEAGTKFMHF